MNDAAPAPDAWAELRAIADALDDQLIVLPDGPEADDGPAAPVTTAHEAGVDPWDELRAIAGAIARERSGLRRQG